MALNPSLETWPEKFGCALADPQLSMQDPADRTTLDFGFKSRQRYVNPIQMGSYVFQFTNEQFKYFQSWHKNTIHNGTDWFNFQVRNGNVLDWQEVKMTAMYESQPTANKFVTVTIHLIQRTDGIPDSSALTAYLDS